MIESNRKTIAPASDMRYPFGVKVDQEDFEKHSIVYAVEGKTNACGVSHNKPAFGSEATNAVVWRGSQQSFLLERPKGPAGSLVHTDALLFTKPQYSGGLIRPVGRVWTNNISTAVAVMWNSDEIAPASLNDPHFTLGSGWVLRRPRSSNAAGWIVGEGVYNGYPRGFVMIRRN
jgi:hypothetical protein